MTPGPTPVDSGAPPTEAVPTGHSCGTSTSDSAPLTLAQCHQVITELSAQVELQREQLARQSELLAVLQERLKLDSRNSSKPPSSDGPGSDGNRAQRRASERKRGAQKGHKGSCCALLDESQVDNIFDCKPVEVCDCGAPVQVLADEPVRHQVFDVPPVKAQVDEYRRYSGRCLGCGKAHRAALPVGVPSGQIGPRALALIGTLGTHYHLTQFKIRDLLARLMGVDFSVGAISQAHGKVAQALKAPMLEVAAHVAQAPVKQLDETSYPREGAGNWAWAVVTPKVVLYSLLPSRARYVATNLIGAKPSGIVVSDRYAVYDFVDPKQRLRLLVARAARRHTYQRASRPGRAGRPRPARRRIFALPLARAGPQRRSVRSPAPPLQTLAAAGQRADPVHAHGQHLRQAAQAGACAVDLPGQPGCATHQQFRGAGHPCAGAQAQNLRPHPLAPRR